MDFAAPQWFLLTLVLPFLVALKLWSRQRGSKGVNRLVAPRLQDRLVQKTPASADWTAFGFKMGALLCFIVAMARPQMGYQTIETFSEGRNVLIGVDTSRSMLAEDLPPNRLTRAKLAALDLVRSLPVDRVGVIAFAGKPFLQAPLTVDHDAILDTINQLDSEIIPRGGTNLTEAALLAMDVMNEGESGMGALVIFSDGEDLEGGAHLEEFQKRAEESGLMIISVGVGTEGGAIIPDPGAEQEGVFIRDESGEIVRSRLQEETLRRLARETGGLYLNMGGQASVADVVRRALEKLEAQRGEAEETRVPIEQYYWPLILGMLLLVLSYMWPMTPREYSTRTPAAAAFLLTAGLLSLLSPNSRANEAALEAYKERQYEKAQELYLERLAETELPIEKQRLQFALGASAFRSGDLDSAKQAFGEALRTRNRRLREETHYNLGNTLYRSGAGMQGEREAVIEQWKGAIQHYESALELNPDSEKAKQNLEFVRQQLENLQNQPPPPPQQDQNQDQQDQNEQNEDQEQDQQNQDQNQNQDQEQNQNQDPGQNQPPEGNPDDQQDQQQPPPEGQPDEEGEPEDQPPPGGEPEKNEGEQPGQPPPSQGGEPPKYSPEQARQILENLSDEDTDAKPLQAVPFKNEVYKNW